MVKLIFSSRIIYRLQRRFFTVQIYHTKITCTFKVKCQVYVQSPPQARLLLLINIAVQEGTRPQGKCVSQTHLKGSVCFGATLQVTRDVCVSLILHTLGAVSAMGVTLTAHNQLNWLNWYRIFQVHILGLYFHISNFKTNPKP